MNDTIEYEALESFTLDPLNPRLGRAAKEGRLNRDDVLKQMWDWSLEEIASSFLESGFWPQEAILCVTENHYGEDTLVVVEGNRRVAALLYLKQTVDGHPPNKKWADMVKNKSPKKDLFKKIPFIRLDTRQEVDSFLGFRHVTGIKEWRPAEKAEFIAYLINDRNMSYVDVMRKIGSKTDAVRRNYISYSLLIQMDAMEEVPVDLVEDRFSVLYLSLRTPGVRKFLNLNLDAEPEDARTPIDEDHKDNLREYIRWLFGDEETKPFVKDSRQVDKFGVILANAEALTYLRKSKKPNFEKAYALAGGEIQDVVEMLTDAAVSLSDALSLVHRHITNPEVRSAANAIIEDAKQLENVMMQGSRAENP